MFTTRKIISLLFFLIQIQQISAFEIDPEIASQQALDEKLTMPIPDPDGRIQTLNKKGAMSPQLDQISKKFVEDAAQPGHIVLEIGAGYGLACLEALQKGAENYTVNDMDARHLKILALNLKKLNPDYLKNIHLMCGSFPDELNLLLNTYDAILMARVLHFMTPDQLKWALKTAYERLKPGGKIYAVMLSPYVRGYKSFIPEFENRIRLKHPNPGYVENLLDFADKTLIPASALKNMEKTFFFFDKFTAETYFKAAGFDIETNLEMPLAYASKIWQLDGRENIGVIAKKPLLKAFS